MSGTLVLQPGAFAIGLATSLPGIRAAAEDLARDFGKVLGARPALSDGFAAVSVTVDSSLAPESFRIEITETAEIRGGCERGAIYGIYEFSRRYLGVDPCWFWKDLEPETLPRLTLPCERIESGTPAFRFRGWFLNDEDLLAAWKESGGKRFLAWPGRDHALALGSKGPLYYESRLLEYYTPVAAAETMEMVFEALLRLRGNLVIPASFTDIFNEPEAAIIRAAVRRGLYVSQHHVEPLGVSHFAYETWWAGRGEAPAFSYRLAPEAMRACWRAHAERWMAEAGNRVIWQIGLRGRGDRPLWSHDPEAKEQAAALISNALAEQMRIIRSVDSRPEPPATLTLWSEGAELIRSGRLRLPENVVCVFSDSWLKQEMQEDFHTLPREAQRGYGLYYHVAVWGCGPHLVQGPLPSKIFRITGEVASRGDTDYAILNVSNVREHLMGIAAWMEQVWKPEPRDESAFLKCWAPPEWEPFYRELLDAIPDVTPGRQLYDGSARMLSAGFISSAEKNQPPGDDPALLSFLNQRVRVGESADRLERLLNPSSAV